MYSKLPNLVIGFHGCDVETYNRVIHECKPMKKSENDYDWLGHGIYFWENNYQRALEWAERSPKIETPAVIGAVIDLGYCLNLTDSHSSEYLKLGYNLLKKRCNLSGVDMPHNRPSKVGEDVLLRDLDCSVIQQIHDYNIQARKSQFDSVRGVFIEGNEPYPGSEFKEKTHVQLCIVNPNCIKGYFSPISPDKNFSIP